MPFKKATAVLSVALLAFVLFFTANSLAQKDQQAASKVQELKEKRIEVLKQLVENANLTYRTGRSTFGQLLSAREALFTAQLALETDHEKRIALYEKRLEIFQFDEDLAKTRVNVGDATADEALRATAQRLLAEIDLAEEIAK